MQEQEIHLRDYWRVLKRRRYTLFTFFIVVVSVVSIFTLTSTPLYTASTRILIERQFTEGLTPPYFYLPYDPEFYETQYQLIKSAAVAERVLDKLQLPDRYNYYFGGIKRKGILDALKELVSGTSSQASAQQIPKRETLKKMIMNALTVKPIRKSKIVEVSFESPSAVFAADVVNATARAYMEELMEMKMRTSKYKLQWLSKKAEEERKRLQQSEKALQEYMKKNDIVTLENRIAIIPQRLTELSTELTKAEAKRKSLEALYQKITSIIAEGDIEKAETIPAVAADNTVRSLRQEILKAEQNIMELSKKFGKKHPKMKRALSELEILKKKKRQEIMRVIESIKTDYELAKVNENNLRKLLHETKQEALRLNEKFIQYGVLKREVETNKQLFEALIKKIKEESVTEKMQTVNVWIVEEAEVPSTPTKPKKALNIMLGIIVGFFGGIGLAFFVEYLDNTVKTPEDVEQRLGLPVIGMVTQHKNGENLHQIGLEDGYSLFSENIKSLRTSVFLSFADSPPRCLLITSPGPDEGKTTIASNLAIVVAKSECSVLLIDADLRNPRLHRLFDLDNTRGLTSFLAGTCALEDIIQEGPLSTMSIITAGPASPRPSELLSSKKLPEMIETLKGQYELIIMDSPPVMTVSDGMILSSVADGTILIAKASSTTYDILTRAIRSLKDVNANLLGVVINSVDLSKDEYYYYSYYGYYTQEEINRTESRRPSRWLYVPVAVATLALVATLGTQFLKKNESTTEIETVIQPGAGMFYMTDREPTVVYSKPDKGSTVLARLPKDIKLRAELYNPQWYVVYAEDGSIKGYIPAGQLRISDRQ